MLFSEKHDNKSITLIFNKNLTLKDSSPIKNKLQQIKSILGNKKLIVDFTACEHVDSSNTAFIKLFVDNMIASGSDVTFTGLESSGIKFSKVFSEHL